MQDCVAERGTAEGSPLPTNEASRAQGSYHIDVVGPGSGAQSQPAIKEGQLKLIEKG